MSKSFRGIVAAGVALLALWSASRTIHPGPLSIDEVTYLLMARSFAGGSGVVIENGFEDLHSDLLTAGWTKIVGGRIVSQYPDLWTLLVAPLFARAGFAGLFWANVLSFLIVVGVVVDLGRRLSGQRTIGAVAGALFAGASFAWEYAVAAWPHMMATALICCAVWAVARSFEGATRRHVVAWAGGAGFLAGLATGVRLDSAFALAGLAVVFLLVSPTRKSGLAAFALGSLPPLGALAALNLAKFGVASPFSYGPSWGSTTGLVPYLPLIVVVSAALAVAWALTRPGAGPIVRAHSRALLVGASAVLMLALAWPLARAGMVRLFHGVLQLLVDLRLRPLDIEEGALSRGPGGSLVYAGTVKKALLQSCPYLVVGIAPLLARLRRAEAAWQGLLLGAVPASYIVVFGAFAWHGGLCFNLRYFVPVLPFLAILCAEGTVALWRRGGSWIAPALAVVVAVSAYGLRRAFGPLDLAAQGFWYLTVPLVLAIALTLALMASSLRPSDAALRAGCRALAAVAVAWASLVAIDCDLRQTLTMRSTHARAAQVAQASLAGRGLLLSTPLKLFAAAVDRRSYAIADPADDGFRSLVDLVGAAERLGWPVYYGLPRGLYQHYRTSILAPLETAIVLESGPVLVLAVKSRGAQAGRTPAP